MRGAVDIREQIDETLGDLEQTVREEQKSDDSRYRVAKSNLTRFGNFLENECPSKYFVGRPAELRETIYQFILQDDNQINSTYLRPFKTLIADMETKHSGEYRRNLKMIRDWIKTENFPTEETSDSITYYDDNQLDCLFEQASDEESVIIHILIETGVRAGVAALFTKEDFSDSKLKVEKQYKQGNGIVQLPERRIRKIPIDRELRDKIQRFNPKSKYLFGEEPQASKDKIMEWSDLEKAVKFEVRAEYFRNTCAAKKLSQGVPPETVAETYLGNKGVEKVEQIKTEIE